MREEFIDNWLSEVSSYLQSSKDSETPRPRKRRRGDSYSHLPSPQYSISDMSEASDTGIKRQVDNDQTPKAKKQKKTKSTASESQGTETSQQSSHASTQLHFKALELTDRGVIERGINGLSDHPSEALATFIEDLENVMACRNILPLDMRAEFQRSENPRFSKIGKNSAAFSSDRRELGQVPSHKTVLRLVRIAEECLTNKHDEASWNVLVHSRVLSLALQLDDGDPFSDLVNFFPCSSASIISKYLPPLSLSKKVDFCICIDASSSSPQIQATIKSLRNRLADRAINHTGYYALRKRPIAISIETKQPDQGWDRATLQLSVWQASHWNFLQELNVMARATLPTHQDIMPAFLPCIIIQGQDWKLVVTTREGSQTVFWKDIDIGSTKSVLAAQEMGSR
ncbi:uncharacterized protein NECHADRAFT_89365 [Fusarium vanettenii 77-13-4]|uniref:PD-(D/E)XK nuclease-like domain-containing protein n=1 Tax=Fusarium vanettenii (strain ATCC MYA-4622 / CBS 123669 / FGSC 9596 / NRRL 45880 / 77-13-4) TaxID=660122 RepID=C7ZQZ7_FUSV7|nr:uncharacterized protein NECHADRAFT_89365 [Fusarium vanettenii 77-13-4]EEU33560.1 hypothetical protein NECHADRAFT_89365 [Fusarium vanettenii 77-13-4]